jgi:hypothetical protein
LGSRGACSLPSFINDLQNFREIVERLHGVLGSRGLKPPQPPLRSAPRTEHGEET